MGESRSSRNVLQFGDFELDPELGELRKNGAKVRLQDQPLQVLQILLEQPGKVMSRDELQRRIWPSDTFVDFDHGINNAIKRLREALGDTAEMPRYIETLPRRGYRFIGRTESYSEKSSSRARSLAVLPLENLSNDPEQEYFAEGLTEALITTLAKIGQLRVVSRTSCMPYKRVRKALREIAYELQVDTVVEGTVLRDGNRVRITAQLIDASQESHLWAESYERDLQDVLTVQSEIAHAIANQIQITLSPQEKEQLAQVRTVMPEAYEAYLKGRYNWNRRSPESLAKAAECFQLAIAKDSRYAPAYAGLADCANSAGWWGFVAPNDGCGKAKLAALRALDIDSLLPDAHTSLAWSLLHYDFDFLGAEKEFRRALELNPRSPSAIQRHSASLAALGCNPTIPWHAASLTALGHLDDAVTEVMRALDLDPLSPIINTTAGLILWQARQFDRAVEVCRHAIEVAPEYPLLRWTLAVALAQRGEYDSAITELDESLRVNPGAPLFLFLLGSCHASMGREQNAIQILDELQKISTRRYVSAVLPAVIYTALNNKSAAFHWLDIAYRERAAWMAYVKVFPWFDNIRHESQFADLLRRMNHQDGSKALSPP